MSTPRYTTSHIFCLFITSVLWTVFTYALKENKSLQKPVQLSLMILVPLTRADRIIGSFRLEKVLEIIESDHKPNSVKPVTKPGP